MISRRSPLKQRIRDLGERLDAHRKRQQEQHHGLTPTGMYNVLEKLRADETLTAKEKQIHDQGLVTLLKQIHDELDEAVLEAYGWRDLTAKDTHCSGGLPPSIANEEAPPLSPNGIDAHRATLQDISSASSNFSVSASQHFSICPDTLLTRLVALNHAHAAEEKRGIIRWLRGLSESKRRRIPTRPSHASRHRSIFFTSTIHDPRSPAWPERLPSQVTLIRQLLASDPTATPEQLSSRFGRKNAKRSEQIEGIIETLRGLGQV